MSPCPIWPHGDGIQEGPSCARGFPRTPFRGFSRYPFFPCLRPLARALPENVNPASACPVGPCRETRASPPARLAPTQSTHAARCMYSDSHGYAPHSRCEGARLHVRTCVHRTYRCAHVRLLCDRSVLRVGVGPALCKWCERQKNSGFERRYHFQRIPRNPESLRNHDPDITLLASLGDHRVPARARERREGARGPTRREAEGDDRSPLGSNGSRRGARGSAPHLSRGGGAHPRSRAEAEDGADRRAREPPPLRRSVRWREAVPAEEEAEGRSLVSRHHGDPALRCRP